MAGLPHRRQARRPLTTGTFPADLSGGPGPQRAAFARGARARAPRAWGEPQHGEEIIATALELRESDAAADERWGLIRAGLLTRLRERPPFLRWLAYRSLDARVPPRYRMWVRDDVLGRWYALRRLVAVTGLSALILIPLSYVTNPGGGLVSLLIDPVEWSSWGTVWAVAPMGIIVGVWAAALTVLSLATTGHYRRKVLRKHGFHPDGTPVQEAEPNGPDGHRRPLGN